MGSLNGMTNGSSQHGLRNFVDVIDELALNEPNRTIVSIPRSSNAKDGWKDLGASEYANAINRLAHWIVDQFGRAKENDYPTVAYIGPNDVRYLIVLVATIKAGYKALFISPRNNIESQMSLFEATDCQFILHTEEYDEAIKPWLGARPMKSSAIGAISDMLNVETVPSFPYHKSFEDIRDKPAFILHTSGSTGIPKPIICRHGVLSLADAYRNRPDFAGYRHIIKAFSQMATKILCPMPLFHALGIYIYISTTIFFGTPLVLPIPDQAVTPDAICSFIKHSGADAAIVPPSILADMSYETEDIEFLKKLSFVSTGGGGLDTEAGDRLVEAGVTLANIISTTESGLYPVYFQSNTKLWNYFVYDDETFGAEYRPYGENTFEQVIIRRDKNPGMQGIFCTFPELNEYYTKDLYRPHPTIPHLWRHSGRADDVIVFSNGEKLNPVSIESAVSTHHDLQRAIVVGQGKFQAGIFLEPLKFPKDNAAALELIESVWPMIDQANQQTVAHGRIARHLVRISDPTKPIPASAKGSLQRVAFLTTYKDEIESLYSESNSETIELSLENEGALMKSLHEIIETSLGVKVIEPDTDFFATGIDSLGIINLGKLITAGLQSAGVPKDRSTVTVRAIYGNPSLQKLSQYVFARAFLDSNTNGVDEVEVAKKVLERFSIAPINETISNKPLPSDTNQTIILTGSTGSLGSYLLDLLEGSDSVSKVICLNRGADGGRQRQIQGNAERGLRTDFPKTEFLEADLSKDNLGLSPALYQSLLSSTDRIIHNAWPVNFNLSVESFAPSIHGVRSLAEFSFRTIKHVPIIFLSSIGSVDRWAGPDLVPEILQTDLSLASTGYGQSKFIGDLILQQAYEKLNVPSAVIRVGQISGPRSEKGAWNKQEWLPTIISSSVALGKLPTDLGANDTVDWVPVEDVAKSVLEISGVLSKHLLSEISGHFHIVNPAITNWKHLAGAVKEFYEQQGREIELVDMATWVKAVGASSGDGTEIPAVKLLDTYNALVAGESHFSGFSTTKTRGVSTTLDQMTPVDSDLMKLWCRQWAF
ncbi:hypothetical protein N7478_005395 [Penicillium angulare]|uniref:uncharacterized protein n=1 Tax=Penicillium angulare TaxID=116970 RepID=UPI0025422667|nr:uncharacterized protein N7478_005395 [Penicillium angulare]KAJ5280023.1 hypothetical protein N7478_005395 [Penicillium angulare]